MIQSIPSAAGSAPGGAVGGGGNLTTVGAVPYVVSAGVLGQAPTGLFYDAANVRLGVGTGSPANIVDAQTGGSAIISTRSTSAATNALFEVRGGSSRWYAGIAASHDAKYSIIDVNTSRYVLQVHGTTDNITIGGTTDGNYKLDVQASGSTGTLRAFNQAVGGSTLVVVQAGDTQSGNLLSVRNNGGTEIASVTASGGISLVHQITIGADYGYNWTGRSGITSPSSGVITVTDNAGVTFNRLQFGGTTSSYPALKRNGTSIETRLADDSAYAPITTGIHKFAGTNSTGAGSALLGANSPASTLTAPYTWITVVTSDGSTAYIPAWK